MPTVYSITKTIILGLGLLGYIILAPASARASSLTGQCANLPIKESNLELNAVFPVNLPPYGDVCFAAHRVTDNLPDDIDPYGTDPSQPQTTLTYIALSLYQNGKDIYDLTYPNTPDYLWNSTVDKVSAVAFRNISSHKFKDILVIGYSYVPGTEGMSSRMGYLPLIFRGSASGFKIVEKLSFYSQVSGPPPLTISKLIEIIKKYDPTLNDPEYNYGDGLSQ